MAATVRIGVQIVVGEGIDLSVRVFRILPAAWDGGRVDVVRKCVQHRRVAAGGRHGRAHLL